MIVKLVARSALAIVLLLSVLAHTSQAATHQTVPSANFSFIPDLQTFLRSEDASRHADLYPNAVVSGGIHSTAAGLTGSPSALLAYLSGTYTTETGTITYPNTSVCWVIAHPDTTGNVGSFTRVSGTHYLLNCGSIPQPTLPTLPSMASVYLMKVTTTGGAITEVEGTKATQAIARLERARRPEDFEQALADLEGIINAGLVRAYRSSGANPAQPAPGPRVDSGPGIPVAPERTAAPPSPAPAPLPKEQRVFPKPTPEIIDELMRFNSPADRESFDRAFGPGAADAYLKGRR